jgi:hypothetical protein
VDYSASVLYPEDRGNYSITLYRGRQCHKTSRALLSGPQISAVHEFLDSTKRGEFLGLLSDCQLVKKDTTPSC